MLSYSSGVLNANVISAAKNYNLPAVRKNDLNIPPHDENAILKLEVELRDKNVPAKKYGKNKAAMNLNVAGADLREVCMEKVRDSCNSLILDYVSTISPRFPPVIADSGRLA